jgi:nitrogen fixation protein FixH
MVSSASRSSDRFIPWYIVAFFAFFILLLSSFAWIAIRSYTGEVTEDAYKKGLAYNAVIGKAEEQARIGWKGTLQISAQGRKAHIIFMLSDAGGHPIKDAKVSARCVRLTQAGGDALLMLTPDGKGRYDGSIMLAWLGQWKLHVSATYGGHNFQQVRTVILP